jgi:PIN domain nuclease of toxin-antitoxin system
MSAYLDTHITLWLYSGQTERLSKRATNLINRERVGVSPVVLLELQYLREIGRVTAMPRAIIMDLKQRLGLGIEDRSLETVMERALGLIWTRDVFDRLIVAQATLDDAELVTSDRLIRKHYSKAVW